MNYWGIFFTFVFIPIMTALVLGTTYYFDKVNEEM